MCLIVDAQKTAPGIARQKCSAFDSLGTSICSPGSGSQSVKVFYAFLTHAGLNSEGYGGENKGH